MHSFKTFVINSGIRKVSYLSIYRDFLIARSLYIHFYFRLTLYEATRIRAIFLNRAREQTRPAKGKLFSHRSHICLDPHGKACSDPVKSSLSLFVALCDCRHSLWI